MPPPPPNYRIFDKTRQIYFWHNQGHPAGQVFFFFAPILHPVFFAREAHTVCLTPLSQHINLQHPHSKEGKSMKPIKTLSSH